MNPPTAGTPGWYTDPINSTQVRYWDGTNWTNDTYVPANNAAATDAPLPPHTVHRPQLTQLHAATTHNARVAYKTISRVLVVLGVVAILICGYFGVRSMDSCTTALDLTACVSARNTAETLSFTALGAAFVILIVAFIVEKAGR